MPAARYVSNATSERTVGYDPPGSARCLGTRYLGAPNNAAESAASSAGLQWLLCPGARDAAAVLVSDRDVGRSMQAGLAQIKAKARSGQ